MLRMPAPAWCTPGGGGRPGVGNPCIGLQPITRPINLTMLSGAFSLPDLIRIGAERPFASEPPQLFPDLSIVEWVYRGNGLAQSIPLTENI
jgi:hypothetical protein